MSIYYPLSRIEECLAAEYEEQWTDDTLFEKPRILSLEFYKLLRAAIKDRQLKLYSGAGRLIGPGDLGRSLKQCLNREEFSHWLKEHRLPYSIGPEKFKPKTLAKLKESGELRADCIDIVNDLKARGFPPERIDKQKVATELSKTSKYNHKEATIFHRIRRWW